MPSENHKQEISSIKSNVATTNISQQLEKLYINNDQTMSFHGYSMMINPIGMLQEMCMSRGWPIPFYELEHEEGLSHAKEFTIVCEVLQFREVGIGKTKKAAKRMAACKMWQKLQDLTTRNDKDLVITLETLENRYNGLKNTKINKLGKQQSCNITKFYKALKQSSGKILTELQTVSLNAKDFPFTDFLENLASEQKIEVIYVHLEEKTLSGLYQCLVQLSDLPVAVCHGVGKNSMEAKASAARNTLEYLKMITKK